MKKYTFIIAILISFSAFAPAQAPVLFDGTNPIALSFQSAPSDDSIPHAALIMPADLAKELKSAKQKPIVLEVGPPA